MYRYKVLDFDDNTDYKMTTIVFCSITYDIPIRRYHKLSHYMQKKIIFPINYIIPKSYH